MALGLTHTSKVLSQDEVSNLGDITSILATNTLTVAKQQELDGNGNLLDDQKEEFGIEANEYV